MSKKKNKKNKVQPYQKIGVPPGSVLYHGDVRTEKVKVTLIEYDEHDFTEREFKDLDNCISNIHPNKV